MDNLDWKIDESSAVPIYAQIEQALQLQVARGVYRPGDRLPTVRQLAVDLKVNSNTVARVYLELERQGIVETRRGQGTFVAAGAVLKPRELDRAQLDQLCRAFARQCLAQGFSLRDVRRTLASIQVNDRKGRGK